MHWRSGRRQKAWLTKFFRLRSLYNVVKDPRGGGPRSQLGLPHKSSAFGHGKGPSSRVKVVSFELLYSFLAYETEMLGHSPRYRYISYRCRRPQYSPTNRHPQEVNYENQSTCASQVWRRPVQDSSDPREPRMTVRDESSWVSGWLVDLLDGEWLKLPG
jgi:hypothetical protein